MNDDTPKPVTGDSPDHCLKLLGESRVMDADFMLRRLRKNAPDHPRHRLLEFRISVARNDQPRAYLAAQELGDLEKLPPPLRLSAAQAAYAIGRLDEAERTIETIPIDLSNRNHAVPIRWRLWILIRGRKLDRAEAFLKSIEGIRKFQGIRSAAEAEIALKREDPSTAREIVERLLEDGTTTVPVRFEAAFLLARACEELGDADAAFAAAERGNRIHNVDFDRDAYRTATDELIDRFSPASFLDQPRSSVVADTPTLIVGMPRSGTSLIEQIIASHPDAFGVGEQQTAFRVVEDVSWIQASETDSSPTTSLLEDATNRYLQMHLACGAKGRRVTNKALGMDRIIGDLVPILPETRIVFVERDPRDVLLSIHQHPLNLRSHPWSTRLGDAMVAIESFRRLSDHWMAVVPNPVYRVNYETLVTNQESETKRLLEFLKLAPDPSCLAFENNDRAVLTPSADQLRRGLNTDGIGRWERYRSHLQPWIDGR